VLDHVVKQMKKINLYILTVVLITSLALGFTTSTQTLPVDVIRAIGDDVVSINGTLFINGTSGNVGIGTQTPNETLTLLGGSFSQKGGDATTSYTPTRIGNLSLGTAPQDVFVSGRYAYVIDNGANDLKVIDVSNPSSPELMGILSIGGGPTGIHVSGRYAYVASQTSDDLKVVDVSNASSPQTVGSIVFASSDMIDVFVSGKYAYVIGITSNDLDVVDVSDPTSPKAVGTLGIGAQPTDMYVSGRYAYVSHQTSNNLSVIDVSNPSAPVKIGNLTIGANARDIFVSGRFAYIVGPSNNLIVIDISNSTLPKTTSTLTIGGTPAKIFVSGRYAYVVDSSANDLRVIDISNPSAPVTVGTLGIGDVPNGIHVSGRYAYVVDSGSDDLKVIDISGIETQSAIIHSLEAGSLQVRESAHIDNQLSVRGSINIGAGGLFSDGDVATAGQLSVKDNFAVNGSVFFVNATSGNVGIGFTNSTKKLLIGDGTSSITIHPTGGSPQINTTSKNISIASSDGSVIFQLGG